MIDRRERIDASVAGGLQLLELELAFVGGQRRKIETLQSDRGLIQIDQFDAGHRAQDIFRRFDDAGDARMLVQRDAQVHALTQQRP